MNEVDGTLFLSDEKVLNILPGWIVIAVKPRTKRDAKSVRRIFRTIIEQFKVGGGR